MSMDLNALKVYLLVFAKDNRITVWHMAVIYAIIQLAKNDDLYDPISISRRKVMLLAHINSIVTYHKCIKELQALGYINYCPSYHPAIGSRVQLLKK